MRRPARNFLFRSTVRSELQRLEEQVMTDTILVVENEPFLLIDLSEQLCAAGYDVIEAASGEAARRILQNCAQEDGQRVDIVVTDVRMPGALDGIGLARWVRSTCNLPVILVSGEMTIRDLPGVADARFAKPVDMGRLLAKIAELLGRQS